MFILKKYRDERYVLKSTLFLLLFVSTVLLSALSVQATEVPGLVFHARLDNETSLGENSSIAIDRIGGGKGNLSGAFAVQGKLGGALRFLGAGSGAFAPDLQLGNQVSISFWYNMTGPTGNFQDFVSKRPTGNVGSFAVEFRVEDNTIACGISTSGVAFNGFVRSNAATDFGNWHHVACTYDGTRLLQYIDGVLQNQVALLSGNVTQTPNSQLTIASNNNAFFYNGVLDDVRIYNRAITQAEVLQVMQGTASDGLAYVSSTPQNGSVIIGRTATIAVHSNSSFSNCQVLIQDRSGTFGNGSRGSLVVTTANTVLNSYTFPIGAIGLGATSVQVSSVTGFFAGENALILGMTGASAGRYDLLRVRSVNAATGTLMFDSGVENAYAAAPSVTQVVNVPEFSTLTVQNGSSITASSWNGVTGGVVAFKIKNSLNLIGNIDVSGKGYRGGNGIVSGIGFSGESISGNGAASISANAGGGGGGGGHVNPCGTSSASGGGGAGHASQGGFGVGSCGPLSPCSGQPGLKYSVDDVSRLFMGSGGGGTGGCTGGTASTGANGGGMMLLSFGNVTGNGVLRANGGDAIGGSNFLSPAGGGGAGGSIVTATSLSSSIVAIASGGAGGSGAASGGAGSGGIIATLLSPFVPVSVLGMTQNATEARLLVNLPFETYVYHVQCTASPGNEVLNSAIQSFTLVPDTSAPVIAFLNPTPISGTSLSGSIPSRVEANDSSLSSVEIRVLNGSSIVRNVIGLSPIETNFTGLPPGSYVLSARAVDDAGNVAFTENRTILVIGVPVPDVTAPISFVSLRSGNSAFVFNTSTTNNVSVNLSCSDAGSGCAFGMPKFCLRKNDCGGCVLPPTCTVNTSNSGIFSVVGVGNFTLCFASSDNSSNNESITCGNITRLPFTDTSGPLVSLSGLVGFSPYVFGTSATSPITVSVSCVDQGDLISGCNELFACVGQDNCFPSLKVPSVFSVSQFGTSKVCVRATDITGNSGQITCETLTRATSNC